MPSSGPVAVKRLFDCSEHGLAEMQREMAKKSGQKKEMAIENLYPDYDFSKDNIARLIGGIEYGENMETLPEGED